MYNLEISGCQGSIVFLTTCQSHYPLVHILSPSTLNTLQEAIKLNEVKHELRAPATGRCLPVSQAESQLLRSKSLGDGVAIYPENGAIQSPCDGKVIEVAPDSNFIKILSEDNLELLVLLGIETAELGGQGYRILVQQGHRVRRGQKIATMNINMIESEGYDISIALLITNTQQIQSLKTTRGDVNAGKDVVIKASSH